MMKRCRNLCRTGPFLLAVLILLLSGCSTAKRASGTENGLRIEADQKEYVLCSPFALKPISVGDLYAQAENASSPIVVTLSGISMLVRPVQPENAYSSIVVTLSGIVMLVRP